MKSKKRITAFLLAFSLMITETVLPCTRIVYEGLNGTIITARSMDWKGEIPANLWIFPRGINRNGEVGTSSVKWKSKYGSVITSSWDIASSDGMNEKGLVGNLLWLVESQYPKFEKDGKVPGLAVSLWLQYVLDNFSTVSEAVNEFEKREFVIASSHIPNTNIFATLWRVFLVLLEIVPFRWEFLQKQNLTSPLPVGELLPTRKI